MKTLHNPSITRLPPILIVDDDPDVLCTLRALTESMNTVRLMLRLDPSSAEEAATDPAIGLIICDYRFPNASGIDFIEGLRKRGIRTPVLFISGTPDSDAVLQASRIEHSGFLGKPFSITRFREAIFALLGKGGAGG